MQMPLDRWESSYHCFGELIRCMKNDTSVLQIFLCRLIFNPKNASNQTLPVVHVFSLWNNKTMLHIGLLQIVNAMLSQVFLMFVLLPLGSQSGECSLLLSSLLFQRSSFHFGAFWMHWRKFRFNAPALLAFHKTAQYMINTRKYLTNPYKRNCNIVPCNSIKGWYDTWISNEKANKVIAWMLASFPSSLLSLCFL